MELNYILKNNLFTPYLSSNGDRYITLNQEIRGIAPVGKFINYYKANMILFMYNLLLVLPYHEKQINKQSINKNVYIVSIEVG